MSDSVGARNALPADALRTVLRAGLYTNDAFGLSADLLLVE